MKVLGIEIPPPEELLPGPIEGSAAPPSQPALTVAAPANGAASNGSGDLEAAATS